MRNDGQNLYWAADGGGTRCRMALVDGARRWSLTLGPANVTSDFDAAVSVLRDGMGQLSHEAGLPGGALAGAPAYLGLAGVMDTADGDRVAQALGLTQARVEDDRPAAVRGALGEADGTLASLGTGSFFARQRDGSLRLAGGWGARLGDEASGFWLGRMALSLTLDAVDGLRDSTELTAALVARFDASASGIVRFAASAAPGEMAALAPLVVTSAQAGDEVGRMVMRRGAAHVIGMLAALGHEEGDPVCLTGGLADAYRAHLPAAILADLVAPQGSALDGALSLAAQRAVRA